MFNGGKIEKLYGIIQEDEKLLRVSADRIIQLEGALREALFHFSPLSLKGIQVYNYDFEHERYKALVEILGD